MNSISTSSINYSDGDSDETRILRLLRDARDLSSNAQIGAAEYDANWAVKYHLSPQRANLLRHLDFGGLDVLEIGAGMGGVSRFLAEASESLFVIEGTEPRFAALSERLRDLDNWSGVVGNLQDIELDKKFDVVCVVGVLEYAEMFVTPSPGQTAFEAFLHRAVGHLKADGVLILAIENKLGLKYWSGSPEDHCGRLFEGICGYPTYPSAKTFSRREMLGLLKGAGLSSVQWSFPFPDYKLPSSVLTEDLIADETELARNLASYEMYSAHAFKNANLFPDVLAMETVVNAGLLTEMSNSFLILASNTSDSTTLENLSSRQRKNHEVCWHYASNRQIPTITVFTRNPENLCVWVEKKRLLKEFPDVLQKEITLPEGDMVFRWQSSAPQQAKSGINFRSKLLKLAYFDEWDLFTTQFRSFLAWSFDYWKLSGEQSCEDIDGKALDAVISNALVAPEQQVKREGQAGAAGHGSLPVFDVFDLEWILEGKMNKSWFILRNIMNLSVYGNGFFTTKAPFHSYEKLYEVTCAHFGLVPRLDKDIHNEACFYSVATPDNSIENWKNKIYEGRIQPFPTAIFARDPAVEHGIREERIRMQRSMDDIQRSITYQAARRLNEMLHRVPLMHGLVKRVWRKE